MKPKLYILNIVCPHFPQAGEWRQLRVRGGRRFFFGSIDVINCVYQDFMDVLERFIMTIVNID